MKARTGPALPASRPRPQQRIPASPCSRDCSACSPPTWPSISARPTPWSTSRAAASSSTSLRSSRSPQARPQAGARRRRGGQADGRPHPRQHRGHPPLARRRHRRLRGRRGDDQALHPQGAPAPRLRQPARDHLRALGLDRGRAARHPGECRERRRPARLPDRGADGGRDRRRPAGHRAHRLDGGRHRRRHDRGRDPVPGRHRLRQVDPRRRQQDGRGDHQLCPPQPQPADRRGHGRADQDARSARPACPRTATAR